MDEFVLPAEINIYLPTSNSNKIRKRYIDNNSSTDDNVILNVGITKCEKFINLNQNTLKRQYGEEIWNEFVSKDITLSAIHKPMFKSLFIGFNIMKPKKDQNEIRGALLILVKLANLDDEAFEKNFKNLFPELDIMLHWNSNETSIAEKYWDFKNQAARVDSDKAKIRKRIHSQRYKASKKFIELKNYLYIYSNINLHEPPTKKFKGFAQVNFNSICKYYNKNLVDNSMYEFKISFKYDGFKTSQNVINFSTITI